MSLSLTGRRPARVPPGDGRSIEAVFMRRTRAALLAHCGKDASQIQQRLIDRAVMLSLYVARLDRRAVQAGVLSEHDLPPLRPTTNAASVKGLVGAVCRPVWVRYSSRDASSIRKPNSAARKARQGCHDGLLNSLANNRSSSSASMIVGAVGISAGNRGSHGARHQGLVSKPALTPTAAMNPNVDPAIIAEAFEDDFEAASCEFGAQFRSDLADFVSRAIVEACIEPGVHERPPARATGRHYKGFIDAAGGSGTDSMTMAVSHLENGIATLDCIREIRPPFSPDAVVLEFSALLKSYGIVRAESDRWGGDWVKQAFEKQQIRVDPTAKPKADLYREMLPLLNAHRCALLDHPRLVSQLCALERRTGRSGRDTIDHPPTGHDDVANAVAGALVMASAGMQPMNISADAVAASMRASWRTGGRPLIG